MDECLDLPPGFRFHPTDEEIITHYLTMKVLQPTFTARAIGEVDLNKSEPWDLPSKAKMGEKEWYFFCQRDRKYPTGMRTNRATESGYWKATGKDKEIFRGRGGGGTSSSSSHARHHQHQHQHHHVLVGMKKTLVFYTGRAPKGEKTNWVMHEYRLDGKSPFPPNHLPPRPSNSKDEWVVCRVFHKGNGPKKSPTATTTLMPPAAAAAGAGLARMNSFADILDSTNLPPLLDSTSTPSSSYFNSNNNNNNSESSFDFKGMPSSYYYSMMGLDDLNPNSSSVNAQMGVQIAPPMSSTFNNYNAANFMGYFQQQQQQQQQQQDESVNQTRQCKVEQLPNHSMLSDDTGLSTDRNTEISSVVSRHDIGSCTSYDATAEASLDLDNMWN